MDNKIEEILLALQGARNFLLGMSMDPSLSTETREAVKSKADELDKTIEKYG